MLGRREIRSVLEHRDFAMLGRREIRSVLEHMDFAMLRRREIRHGGTALAEITNIL